jgi:Fe-S oxidoreductase
MKLDGRTEKAVEYCLFCPKMCRFACPVAAAEARETTTPWGLMSLVALVNRGTVELTPEVGEALYHCTSCLRCQSFCKHETDVPAALIEARRQMVKSGVAIPKAVQGIDLRMEQYGSPFGPVPDLPPEADEVFAKDAPIAYLPSCARRFRDPESVLTAGRMLSVVVGEKVELIQTAGRRLNYCCGESLREAGFATRADKRQRDLFKDLAGRKMLITGCGSFRARYAEPKRGRPRVVHTSEVLAEHLPLLAMRVAEGGMGAAEGRVFYHDSCKVGRGFGAYRGPRDVLQALNGHEPDEFWQNKAEAQCCGGGCHYDEINPDGAAVAAVTLASTAADHGADVVVTAEVRCKLHMNRFTEAHVLDLIDVAAQRLGLLRGRGLPEHS